MISQPFCDRLVVECGFVFFMVVVWARMTGVNTILIHGCGPIAAEVGI